MKISNNRLVGKDGKMVDWVASPNSSGKLSNDGRPKTLVIHYTAGGSASSTVSYFKKKSSGVSAHLVIGRNGHITQMLKFNRIGWHAGESEWRGEKNINKSTIGIEIANYGLVKQTASDDWVSWSGQTIPASRVILDEHKHFPGKISGWEIFDQAQMDATIEAAQTIVAEYGLTPWDVIGHEDISIRRKIDPGPAFDMDKFRTMVFGRDEDTWNDHIFVVNSASWLNLRVTPDLNKKPIENMPDGTEVHLISKDGNWWLVAKIVDGNEDVTGYVHSKWLRPV